MFSPLMDTFLIVARYLSFTRAAQELYTTQPTISRQIAALEEEWGCPLFVRSNKEVALTEEGTLMLDACKRSEELLSAALGQCRTLRQGRTGFLRIGVLSSLDEQRTLLPALSYLDEMHPNIEVTVEKGSYSRLREGLEKDEFDVIFTLDFELGQMKDVSVKRIEDLPCCFVLSQKHRLFSKPDLSLDDLSGARFVLPSPEDSPRRKEDLESILHRMGFRGNEIIYAANMDSLMLYLNAGKAVALLHHDEKDFYSPLYRRISLPDDPQCRVCLVGVWKAANRNPAIALLV